MRLPRRIRVRLAGRLEVTLPASQYTELRARLLALIAELNSDPR